METNSTPIRATIELDLTTPEGKAALQALTHLQQISGLLFQVRYNLLKAYQMRVDAGEHGPKVLRELLQGMLERYDVPDLME